MKGLMMNHWALSKKSVCIYLPIAVVICVLFNIGQQGMTGGFLPCYLLAIIALDNLKNEKGSDWPKLALTLPLNRKMYVQSHFLLLITSSYRRRPRLCRDEHLTNVNHRRIYRTLYRRRHYRPTDTHVPINVQIR